MRHFLKILSSKISFLAGRFFSRPKNPLTKRKSPGEAFPTHEVALSEIESLQNYLEKTSKYLLKNSDDQSDIIKEINVIYSNNRSLVSSFTQKFEEIKNLSGNAIELSKSNESAMNKMSVAVTEIQNIRAKLSEINKLSDGVIHLLENVDKMTRTANYLGINMVIQAAHLGEHGRAVAVVAQQISLFAQNMQKLFEDISNQLTQNSDSLKQLDSYVDQKSGVVSELINSTMVGMKSIHTEINQIGVGMNSFSEAVGQYTQSNNVLSETIHKITSVNSNLGTAASNCKLAQVNLTAFAKAMKEPLTEIDPQAADSEADHQDEKSKEAA